MPSSHFSKRPSLKIGKSSETPSRTIFASYQLKVAIWSREFGRLSIDLFLTVFIGLLFWKAVFNIIAAIIKRLFGFYGEAK
jgi:hypothetical protein